MNKIPPGSVKKVKYGPKTPPIRGWRDVSHCDGLRCTKVAVDSIWVQPTIDTDPLALVGQLEVAVVVQQNVLGVQVTQDDLTVVKRRYHLRIVRLVCR